MNMDMATCRCIYVLCTYVYMYEYIYSGRGKFVRKITGAQTSRYYQNTLKIPIFDQTFRYFSMLGFVPLFRRDNTHYLATRISRSREHVVAVCKHCSCGVVFFLRWSLCLCLNISVMGSGKELGRDTIVAIITLSKEGYKCKDIATRLGIRVRQVQKWTKKFRGGGGEDIPAPKPCSGRPRKISNRTFKVIRRQLDKNPTLTARKLKEKNHALLQDVSVKCISDHLRKDLQCHSCCAKVLPLSSAKNIR